MKALKSKIAGYGYKLGAAFTVGMIMSQEAEAAPAGNNFGKIAENITLSIGNVPGLVTGVAYLVGLLLVVLGVLKLKDHVENPTQTPVKDGAVRLAAGGAMLAIPILLEAALNTIGADNNATTAAQLQKVKFNVQ